MNLERKFDLRFQPSVVRVFVEAFAVRTARHLVGEAEQGRGDVADDGAGVVVVQQVADGQPDGQVVTVGSGRRSDEAAESAAGDGSEGGAASRAGALLCRTAALFAEPD